MTFVSAKARQICEVFEIQFATKIQIFGEVKSLETTFHSNGYTQLFSQQFEVIDQLVINYTCYCLKKCDTVTP